MIISNKKKSFKNNKKKNWTLPICLLNFINREFVVSLNDWQMFHSIRTRQCLCVVMHDRSKWTDYKSDETRRGEEEGHTVYGAECQGVWQERVTVVEENDSYY